MGEPDKLQKTGLILAGGGARAAYQVGVLKALSELYPRGSTNPFAVICGTSAGAINSAALAIYGHRFQEAVQRMLRIWRNFHVHQVFRSDVKGIASSGAQWLLAFMVGGLGKRNPAALLNRAPLRQLLERYLPCEQIQKSIDTGVLDALGITASGYSSGHSITFFQGIDTLESWNRVRRLGSKATISIDHLMASSAIPFMFEAKKINREYFGDGSMRQSAPISPALHLGADRVLIIGVSNSDEVKPRNKQTNNYPSLADIGGHILNSIFLDSMEADIERLERINKTISRIPTRQFVEGDIKLRQVDSLVISPSQDLQAIADRHAHEFPRTIRYFLRGLGGMKKNSSSLASYLLFERSYCRELISLGYADTMQRKEEVISFLDIPGP